MDIREEKRFSVAEASRLSGMSLSWWRHKISKKEVVYLKVGGRTMIPESALVNIVKVVEPI